MDAAREQQAMKAKAIIPSATPLSATPSSATLSSATPSSATPSSATRIRARRPLIRGGTREGLARRRAMLQQAQAAPTQEQGSVPSAQASSGRDVSVDFMAELRPGINFGPGRANRIPEEGSPEYKQLLQRIRALNQGQ